MAHGKIIITGNTFAAKDQIRQIPGATWDAGRKAWIVDRDRLTMSERAAADSAAYKLKALGCSITRTA